MKHISSRTVVFITGAFVSHGGWKEWQHYFENKGYATHAPPWPFKDAPATVLRQRHPDPHLASLTLTQLIDHYADFVRGLAEKPVVIGHSLGGLIAQILVNRELVAAGIGIHPVPPKGIVPFEFSFLKAGWKSLGLFTSLRKTYLMSFRDWQYAFTNGMSPEEQKIAYQDNTIPESKRVTRGGLTDAAKVDFEKTHPPLLIIAGSTDTIMPASLNYRTFKRYKKDNGSITEYKEFPGKNHFVVGLPSWKEEADFILHWINT